MNTDRPPPLAADSQRAVRIPPHVDRLALILQGGGALGAYQAGVYEGLHAAGIEPDWIAGVSIGAINGAIIAGNPPASRLERLQAFWSSVTARPVWPVVAPDDGVARRWHNDVSSALTVMFGQPGFFTPARPGPLLSLPGTAAATSFYDTSPLRTTLEELIDFDRLNDGAARYACGAVDVQSGNFVYFDTTSTRITVDHVLASGALPPGLPMVSIEGRAFWDGGLASNTPLQHVLDNAGTANTLVFQVDLFSAPGAVPTDIGSVLNRMKDIQYSSRTRLVTDYYTQHYRLTRILKRVLDKLDPSELTEEEALLKTSLSDLPAITIIHLIYRQKLYEGANKDYDFSRASMTEHWASGLHDTRRTLRHGDWLNVAATEDGVRIHDLHAPTKRR
ncbi:patatin-like phospholipase family protein [Acidisphaera rubrifaciens]|uniref:Phospholipase n=1 Tax=Acidisphaera rubrifaciens HS-AP3 TaxID=1231350 RepID=A0A0D6P2Q7_9PROT|nr:patatin-like phospholipase family protein [Acidisphaera rubrifaciens]GAN76055.1 phospholipase [Acidisphaera rubrifaciens HS-AP3]